MGLFANVFNRFRKSSGRVERARRMFFEPLEGRHLLTAMLSVTKTDDHHVSGIDAGVSTPLV